MKRKMESEIENNGKFEARAGRKAEKDELINKEAWRLKKKKKRKGVPYRVFDWYIMWNFTFYRKNFIAYQQPFSYKLPKNLNLLEK